MSDYLDPIAAAVLAFWHVLPPSEQSTLITASATILAATIGAFVVICQIGRQARNAIKQNRDNEAVKLKLEVYRDITAISREASSAVGNFSSLIRQFHSDLVFARRMQAELNAYVIPSSSGDPSRFTEYRSQVTSNAIKVIGITETWQIIDPRIEIFRKAINAALFDIDAAYDPYFNEALRVMPLGVPKDLPKDRATPMSWNPPSA